MHGLKLSAVALTLTALAGLAAAPPAAAEEVTLTLWSRADRSGPLRTGNIVEATKQLNAFLAASGSDTSVKLNVHEGNATGYDDDALQLLKACAVGQCPDFYVAAHEWVGEFAKDGYAMNMEKFITDNDWAFKDVIPVLWNATKYNGERYAIPQDTEIRMYFYNKDMLRKIGKDEAFIESIPQKVDSGEMTMADFGQLVKEVVDKGAAEYGLLHRPNVGPDYIMTFAAFGVKFMDEKTGKLLLPRAEMQKAFEWFDWMARNGATPENNTAMSWDDIQNAFKQEKAFAFHHGIWDMAWMLGDARGNTWPTEQDAFFHKIGWINAPAGEKGGKPANLSHPIVYVVNPKSAHGDLAAQIIAIATLPYYNIQHAVTTYHLGVLNGEQSMPAYEEAWPLHAASPLLKYTTFIPNHPDFGTYNGILYKGLQGVETGRLSPKDAVAFLEDEMTSQLGDAVEVVDSVSQ